TVNVVLEGVLGSYEETLVQLKVDCGLVSPDKLSDVLKKKLNGSGARSSTDTSRSSGDFELDFDQDGLQQGEWAHFQVGLRLLTNCRSIADKLDGLKRKTKKELLATKGYAENEDEDEEPASVVFNLGHRRESSVKPTNIAATATSSVTNMPKAPLNLLR